MKREARSILCNIIILVSSLVATFEQGENVTIAHLHVAACSEGCGLCNNRFAL